jgi:tRNA-modifying protein YgfZ
MPLDGLYPPDPGAPQSDSLDTIRGPEVCCAICDVASLDRLTTAYRDTWTGRVVLPRPAPDAIVMSGSTRLACRQRMSTNDLSRLDPGRFRWTVLSTPVPQIADGVQLLARADDLLLLTSPGRGAAVVEWLLKYVFYGDDLALRLESAPRQAWLALSPSAATIATAFAPGSECLGWDAWLESGETRCWRVDRPAAGGWAILGPRPGLPVLTGGSRVQPMADSLDENLRIEAGIASPGSEITDERIPLELGLSASISLNKGCCIGPEIIARMSSQDRLARRLIGLQLAGPAHPGAELRQQGTAVGQLTRVACSPRLGWIGLGLVRPAALPAQLASLADGPSSDPALPIDVPFPSA